MSIKLAALLLANEPTASERLTSEELARLRALVKSLGAALTMAVTSRPVLLLLRF
jgi:hypothetical protein